MKTGCKRKYNKPRANPEACRRVTRRLMDAALDHEMPMAAAAHSLREAISGKRDLQQTVVVVARGLGAMVATLRTTRKTLVKLANEPLELTGLEEWAEAQQRRLPGMEA